MQSINRITRFFSSKEAVSRDVALQTAAALQVCRTILDSYCRNDDIFTSVQLLISLRYFMTYC